MLKNQTLAEMRIENVSPMDDRKVEIVAKNLPLRHGLPLVCDASLVSPIRANGIARPRAAHEPRVAIANIEDVRAATYPELVTSNRCKFLVLASEVGGRWSATTCRLIRDLASAKSQEAAPRLRKAVAFALENWWWSMISVATQNALTATPPLIANESGLIAGVHLPRTSCSVGRSSLACVPAFV